MDVLGRRLAALDRATTTIGLAPSDLCAGGLARRSQSGTETAVAPSVTISLYSTALNGVNQTNNMLFKDMLWVTMGVMAAIILVIRIMELAWAYLRQINAMSLPGDRQGFWKYKQWSWMPGLKKHLLYAPLWNKRHNRELRLSSALNMGTLPSRFHAMILGILLASNITYTLILDWGSDNKYAIAAEVRGRSGTLAVVNMVPLIILAGRNNPLISWLRVSFDTYNLIHRWLGRLVVVEAVVHTLAWAAVQVTGSGWGALWHKLFHDTFYAGGGVGTLAMIVLCILASSPIRHAFYETFLTTHIILAFIALAATWLHCASAALPGSLPQLPWVVAIFAIWLFERLARMFRLVYYNWSRKCRTVATVEPMHGDTCRVTMRLARYVDVKPGSHAYIRFSSVSPLENHPFSIAWVEHEYEEELLSRSEKDPIVHRKPLATSLSFVISAQTGFTRKLYDMACVARKPVITLRAAFEGPYGGHHQFDSYGHVVLFAGATGVTHATPYLAHLLKGYNEGTVATRKITLIWIIRDSEALEWIRPWMDTILKIPNRKKILTIKLFVTRPKNTREITSASRTVQMFPGRPNVAILLSKEVAEQVGSMVVSVCGPGSLADDVRQAARSCQGSSCLDFQEESFSW